MTSLLTCIVDLDDILYYILEWMLASSILHVDGACIICILAAIFRYCFVYNVCKNIAFVNFQEIKEILIVFIL